MIQSHAHPRFRPAEPKPVNVDVNDQGHGVVLRLGYSLPVSLLDRFIGFFFGRLPSPLSTLDGLGSRRACGQPINQQITSTIQPSRATATAKSQEMHEPFFDVGLSWFGKEKGSCRLDLKARLGRRERGRVMHGPGQGGGTRSRERARPPGS